MWVQTERDFPNVDLLDRTVGSGTVDLVQAFLDQAKEIPADYVGEFFAWLESSSVSAECPEVGPLRAKEFWWPDEADVVCVLNEFGIWEEADHGDRDRDLLD